MTINYNPKRYSGNGNLFGKEINYFYNKRINVDKLIVEVE